MVADNYACAYKEVIEILKHTKREDVNKIPKYKILLWKTNMDENHEFRVDTNKPLEEQKLSSEAKAIIANIFKNYWATDYQKQRIEAKEKYDMQQLEEKKKEMYNSDNIFNKSLTQNSNKENNDTNKVAMVESKEEKWYSKVFEFFRKIFRK